MLGAVLLLLLSPTLGYAQWRPEQRDEFMNGCLPSCQNNQKINAAERTRCDTYCRCVMQEGEKTYTPADYEVMERLAKDKADSRILKEFGKLYPICSRRVFRP